MKTHFARFLLLSSFLVCGGMALMSQNAPITTAASVGAEAAGPVDVPITVTGFYNIGAISLSIDYNYAVLQFTGATPNPLLSSFPAGDIDLGTGYHRITMGWFGSGVTLSDGSTIMTLHFTYNSGISTLVWYEIGPSCEYADADYNVLNDIPTEDYYINGFVCGIVANPGTISGNNNVCQGQPGEEYSVAPVENATGYVWAVPDGATIMTGQNTNAITVDFGNDAASGDISVYGINDCGNGPASVIAVTVNGLPDAGAGDDFTINYGTSTTLHATPGGTGEFSYHWSPEELLIDPDIQDPITIILTSTSIFTVMVTNQASSCQGSDAVVVTITGGPLSINPVSVPSSICQGESAQLFSNAGGGSDNYTYQWTSDPPGSPPWNSTLANPVVSPDSSRHYFLLVDDGFTTVSGSTYLTVYILPTATISGGDTLCGEDVSTSLQVDLTGTPSWSFTYTYGSTSVFVTDQQTSPYIIIASDPGDYTITTIEDAYCIGTSYGTAIVRKYPIPATPEITINGFELISSSCCGNQWYLNGDPIPGETGQTYYAMVSGLYHVVVTLNSCSSDPSEVVDIIVGIDEYGNGSLSYFPNPAKTQITVQTSQQVKGNMKVTLCSTSGMVIREDYFKAGRNTFSVDISNLPPGLYFLHFLSNDTHAIGKLIVK